MEINDILKEISIESSDIKNTPWSIAHRKV